MDANEDVRARKISRLFQALSPPLKEPIFQMHGRSGPETCNKNERRVPIDGLFVSPGIEPFQGGYTSYGQVVDSDHRALWIDVPFTSFLGFNPPDEPKRPPAD